MPKYVVVLITAPTQKKAVQLSRKILKNRLAACVSIVPKLESLYWWKDKVESAQEVLLMVKTRRSVLKRLFTFVSKNHPYAVPEIIAIPILAGFAPYLQWIENEVR